MLLLIIIIKNYWNIKAEKIEANRNLNYLPYIIEAVISVAVVFITVFLTHEVRDWREKRNAITGTRAELISNIQRCNKIQEDIKEKLNKVREYGKKGLEPLPSFSTSAWTSYKGVILRTNSQVTYTLEAIYIKIETINRVLQKTTELGFFTLRLKPESWTGILQKAKEKISGVEKRLKEAKNLIREL